MTAAIERGKLDAAKRIERRLAGEAKIAMREIERLEGLSVRAKKLLASQTYRDAQSTVQAEAITAAAAGLADVAAAQQRAADRAARTMNAEAKRLYGAADKAYAAAGREQNALVGLLGKLEGDAQYLAGAAIDASHKAVAAEHAAKLLQSTHLQKQMVDLLRGQLGARGFKEILESGVVAPEAVADWLGGMSRILANPKGLVAFHDKFVRLWKAMAISSPGFLIRNSLGAAMNMYADDVSLSNVARFGKAWRDLRAGRQTADSRLVQQLIDVNVMSGGQTGFEVRKALRGERTWNPLKPEFRGYQAIGDKNQSVENFVRGAHGFDRLLKGGTIDDAIDTVFKYHFNYSNLSDFEQRYVKRISPFWTWTSRNLPLQLELLISKPRVFKRYLDVQRNIELLSSEQDIVPGYFAGLGAIRLPFGGDGNRPYLTPDLPFLSAARITDEVTNPKALLQDQVSGFIPNVKLPIELWAGKQFFKDIPFNPHLREAPRSWGFLMPALAGVGLARKHKDGGWMIRDNTAYTIENLLPILGRMRRLLPSDERHQQRGLTTWLSFALGTGVRTNTWDEQRNELYRRNDRVKNIVRDLKDTGRLAS